MGIAERKQREKKQRCALDTTTFFAARARARWGVHSFRGISVHESKGDRSMKSMPARARRLWLLTAVLIFCQPAASAPNRDTDSSTGAPDAIAAPSGCTVFTVSKAGQVFFGGNDDYINPDSYYWVDPGNDQHYGAIWVGTPDNVQQGVNEKGLAYDSNGLPRVNVNPHDEREPVAGGYTSYPIHILRECATVEEVIAWARVHRWHSYMHDQMHFADATGDAVIISAGADGELVFTRKPPGDGFLVSSNFNVAQPANGYSYPCWRYDRARDLLGQLLKREGRLTDQDAAGVLDAVHVGGGTSWTIESLVADLSEGLVYLYYYHQFDRPVVLNVKEEIAGNRSPGPLSELFPNDVRQEAARRYRAIQAKAERCRKAGMAWPALVIASLILLIVLSLRVRPRLRYWVPAVILLGPLALLVFFIARGGREGERRRLVLLESVGDAMPAVIPFLAILFILILAPAVQSAGVLQIVLVLGLPLVVGLLFFHGPLLAALAGRRYDRFLIERLPQALVTTNLGLAGIVAIAIPLVSLSIRICSILPLTVWTAMVWWAIVVLGTLVGSLLLLMYEGWALKSGFQAWSVLARGEGEVRTPSWRTLWWWVPLSYAVLLGGLVAGAILLRVLTRA